MSKFEGSEPTIQIESPTGEDIRVVKITQNVEPNVQNFKFADIKQPHHIQPVRQFTQSSVPQGVISVATTSDGKRENRFMLSQLAKSAFSITKEEEDLMEKRVEERVESLAQKTREDAFKQGYADGVKDGHEAAFKKAEVETSKRLAQIDLLISAMEKAKLELFEANRQFLMDVVYRVSKMILLKELATDKEYLVRLTRELIEKTGLRDNLIVKIHPSDANAMDHLRAGLVKSFGNLTNLTIELTDQVEAGGCILETEWGAIDATLQTQLGQLLGSLDVPVGSQV